VLVLLDDVLLFDDRVARLLNVGRSVGTDVDVRRLVARLLADGALLNDGFFFYGNGPPLSD
jgi:hypothetical protein